MSTALVAAAGLAALAYLVLVARGRTGPAKVLPALLLAIACHAHPLLAAAFVACAIGDAFLLDKGRFFLHGLVTFLLGHLAFVAAFAPRTAATPVWAWPTFGVFAVAMLAALMPHVRGVLRGAIPIYASALVALGITGVSTSLLAGVGAALFLLSDAILAWNRFRAPLPRADLLVMSTYYGALLCLAWAGLADS